MQLPSKAELRDALLTIDWTLLSFFLVKLTPFEFISQNVLKNIGGIALFALFVILFELFGKSFLWTLIGKHHRQGRQVIVLLALLAGFAVLFALVS